MKRLGSALLMMIVLAGLAGSAQQSRGTNPAAPAPQGRGANPAAPAQPGADARHSDRAAIREHAVAADAHLHSRRSEVAWTGSARLSAVHGRLEQAPHRARRNRGRRLSFSDDGGVERRQRDRHVQGRRRLHERRRTRDAGGVPETGRRARQFPRHAVRRRSAVSGQHPRRRQEARRAELLCRRNRLHDHGQEATRSCRACRTSRSPTRRSS